MINDFLFISQYFHLLRTQTLIFVCLLLNNSFRNVEYKIDKITFVYIISSFCTSDCMSIVGKTDKLLFA